MVDNLESHGLTRLVQKYTQKPESPHRANPFMSIYRFGEDGTYCVGIQSLDWICPREILCEKEAREFLELYHERICDGNYNYISEYIGEKSSNIKG